MTTTIQLRVRKDIDTATEKKILALKGSLIAQSFTDIIHYDDDGEEYYINYFTVASSRKEETIAYLQQFIKDSALEETISL